MFRIVIEKCQNRILDFNTNIIPWLIVINNMVSVYTGVRIMGHRLFQAKIIRDFVARSRLVS
jgi:hypothetical protein